MKRKILIFLLVISTFLFILPIQSTYAYTIDATTRISTYQEQVIDASGSFETRRLNFKLYDESEQFFSYNLNEIDDIVSYFSSEYLYINLRPLDLILYENGLEVITYYNVSMIVFTSNQYELLTYDGTVLWVDEWIDVPVNSYLLYTYNLEWSEDYASGLADGYANGYDSGYDDGYDIGYGDGQDDMFDNGSELYGYSETGSYDFAQGYTNGTTVGHNQLWANGSDVYGLSVTDSFDYIFGFTAGKNTNVNASLTNFYDDFGDWIVPAILIVILIGGAVALTVKKRGA